MTDTTTPEQPADVVEPVVPAGVDPIDGLTVNELDIASRQLRCDVYEAVGGKDGLRWAALQRLAWLWAKRRDPQAKLDTFARMTGAELTTSLRLDELGDDDEADAGDDDELANPTAPAPVS